MPWFEPPSGCQLASQDNDSEGVPGQAIGQRQICFLSVLLGALFGNFVPNGTQTEVRLYTACVRYAFVRILRWQWSVPVHPMSKLLFWCLVCPVRRDLAPDRAARRSDDGHDLNSSCFEIRRICLWGKTKKTAVKKEFLLRSSIVSLVRDWLAGNKQ